MEAQTTERQELYGFIPSPGDNIPVRVQPFAVNDDVPEDREIRGAVRKLRNGRAGGSSGIRAEDLKRWLRDAEVEEDEETEGGDGTLWRIVVRLIQQMWLTGKIPQQMVWMVVVLLPKGGGGFRGIGLLEPLWKTLAILLDTRMAVIELHDCLHGFISGRGTGTATLEAKLAQQLVFIEQGALYKIFFDLSKTYSTMDRQRALEILAGYCVEPDA